MHKKSLQPKQQKPIERLTISKALDGQPGEQLTASRAISGAAVTPSWGVGWQPL